MPHLRRSPSAARQPCEVPVAWQDTRSIRLHDLRHGWATLALQAGVDPEAVHERLGHGNISITLNTYSHVTAGLHDERGRKGRRAVHRLATR
jgi:integrase